MNDRMRNTGFNTDKFSGPKPGIQASPKPTSNIDLYMTHLHTTPRTLLESTYMSKFDDSNT